METESKNLREIALDKLKSYLINPGYFSILVLGDSGTGKIYEIDKLITELVLGDRGAENKNENKPIDEKEVKKKYGVYNPFDLETEADIEKSFEKEYILIKNIENLSEKQQNIFFKAMSTKDGTIGLGENVGYKRIIFTSTYDVSVLREGDTHLNNNFWDRISQLVVKFPSFKEFSSNIHKDFKSVWDKMGFKEFPKPPQDGEFSQWLSDNCGTFAGNFRDLDKIAILWHQYRIIEYSKYPNQKFKSDVEARIFRKVRSDFEKFTHFPTQKADASNIFEFEKGMKWVEIERKFKSKFKIWAKGAYVTIKKATEELDMPFRKMDKW